MTELEHEEQKKGSAGPVDLGGPAEPGGVGSTGCAWGAEGPGVAGGSATG